MSAAPVISMVLSFRNEADAMPELIRRLESVLDGLAPEYELIFVNDDSTDASLAILSEKARTDRRIKVINMSRRFGVSECTLAGIACARGQAVIFMDTDLQDPPEVIPQLVEKWRAGADVVHTVRRARTGESKHKLLLTNLAYRLIGSLSDIPLREEAGDFKLVSRRVADELLKLPEKRPYLRGLVCWVGFRQDYVEYERVARSLGETHFPLFRHLLRDIASLHGPAGALIQGATSFSFLPLALFLLIGLAVCAGALVALVWAAVAACFGQAHLGYFLVIGLFFLAGVQLTGIGVVGLYVGRVYDDVRSRPRHIVASTIGFDSEAEETPKANAS